MATIHFSDSPNTNLLASLPIEALNEIYATLLLETVKQNDCSTKTGIGTRGPTTRFHSKSPPPLPIRDYLTRLTKYTPFPRDALLLSSIYLNRISHLSLSTAYSYASSPFDTFKDDPVPPANPDRVPQPLFKQFVPTKPQPVVVFSPIVGPTTRSYSSGSLPGFSLSSSPIPPAPISLEPSSNLSSTTLSDTSPSPSTDSTAVSESFRECPSPSPVPNPKLVRPAPLVNLFTIHRLLLSTLLIATKHTVDGCLSQTRVSKIGGVSLVELSKLEIECLRLLSWSLYVGTHEMEQVLRIWVDKGTELGVISSSSTKREETPIVNEGSFATFARTSTTRTVPITIDPGRTSVGSSSTSLNLPSLCSPPSSSGSSSSCSSRSSTSTPSSSTTVSSPTNSPPVVTVVVTSKSETRESTPRVGATTNFIDEKQERTSNETENPRE